MATLKERIRALEAAANSAQPSASVANSSSRPAALPGDSSLNTTSPSSASLSTTVPEALSSVQATSKVGASPTEAALRGIAPLRPNKCPALSSTSHPPLASSPARRPPSLSVSQATPSPRRPTPTSNHSSPTAAPTPRPARRPSQTGPPVAAKPALPPRLPSRPLASATPALAVSSLTVSAPESAARQTRHGQTPSTSSLASISLSSDGEVDPSSSRQLVIPVSQDVKTREQRVSSAPPLPVRKTSISSIASSSSTSTTRKMPAVSPIAYLHSPTRAPAAAVSYNTYQSAVRSRSRTLPPALAPKPAVVAAGQAMLQPTYAVRRKAPAPPPLTPRPTQQQVAAAKRETGASNYNEIFDALLRAQQDALSRGVVLEPSRRAADAGWKRVSAVDSAVRVLASVARVVWQRSGLSKQRLKDIWDEVAAGDKPSSLSKAQFTKGMRRIDSELQKGRGR